MKCYYCKKMGHIKKECYKWKRDQKKKQDCEEKKDDDADDKALSARSASPCHRAANDCAIVPRDEAIVDSGATLHMIKNDRIITSLRKKMSTDIITAGKSSVKANLEGGTKVLLTGGASSVDITRVLCVPDLRYNLLSVGGLCNDGHTVMFTKNTCTVLNDTTIAGRGKRKEGVSVLGIAGRSVHGGCSKTSEELLTGVRPSVEHL